MRTRIKICGITRLEDAVQAIELGADALGFVFYQKSPRYITPQSAREIIEKLPPFISKVGLFVNDSKDVIEDICQIAGIDVIQLHGDESPDFSESFSLPVIKALAISNAADVVKTQAYKCTLLLDAKAPEGVYGGTGKSFDWNLLTEMKSANPLVLAGGLHPGNIISALESNEWYAVDVSSGVEESKGLKDYQKMKDFCKKVQEFNCRV